MFDNSTLSPTRFRAGDISDSTPAWAILKRIYKQPFFWWSESLNIVNTTISISAFAKYIGMNASLLRQYAAGIKVSQAKSLKRIRQGIAKIKGDLDAGLLIDKPVLQYVWTMCNQKLVVLHKIKWTLEPLVRDASGAFSFRQRGMQPPPFYIIRNKSVAHA